MLCCSSGIHTKGLTVRAEMDPSNGRIGWAGCFGVLCSCHPNERDIYLWSRKQPLGYLFICVCHQSHIHMVAEVPVLSDDVLNLIFLKLVPPWWKLLSYVLVCRNWSSNIRIMAVAECNRLGSRQASPHETVTELVHAARVARYARAFYKPLQRYTLCVDGRRIGVEFRTLLGEVYAIESSASCTRYGSASRLLSGCLRILIALDNRFVASTGSVYTISVQTGNNCLVMVKASDSHRADLLREILPI